MIQNKEVKEQTMLISWGISKTENSLHVPYLFIFLSFFRFYGQSTWFVHKWGTLEKDCLFLISLIKYFEYLD